MSQLQKSLANPLCKAADLHSHYLSRLVAGRGEVTAIHSAIARSAWSIASGAVAAFLLASKPVAGPFISFSKAARLFGGWRRS